MRLLIITYSYTPDLTPRAFRWATVAEQLLARGHEVHVLCAANAGADSAQEGVIVHRVTDPLLNGFARVAARRATARTVGGIDGALARLKGGLRQAARALWRFFYWPDFACGWVLPAASSVRAIDAAQHFDWIISSSHPFSGHLVALLARRECAPTRWFVDISDPFCLMREPSPYNRLLYGWLSRWVEGRVVARADAISVTTDSTAELYEAAFQGCRRKMRVIGPLLSLPVFPLRSRQFLDTVLRLVFVGTIYRNLRSPRYLLACFTALRAAYPDRPMSVHFYGSVNDCAADLVGLPEVIAPYVVVHGLVPRADVLQAMVDADVLVNIGNHSQSQLASKVVEYMAVGRPILNLVSVDHDASVVALTDYPAALTLHRESDWELRGPRPETVDALARFLFDLPPVSETHVQAARALHAPERVALQYAEMLEGHWMPA